MNNLVHDTDDTAHGLAHLHCAASFRVIRNLCGAPRAADDAWDAPFDGASWREFRAFNDRPPAERAREREMLKTMPTSDLFWQCAPFALPLPQPAQSG